MKDIIKIYLWLENIWFKFPQKIRFLLVGGFNTVFAYSVLAILVFSLSQLNEYWRLNYSELLIANIALIIQYIITINVSFVTMRYYVFQSKGNWEKEWVKSCSVYAFIYLINAPILTFLMVICHLSPYVSQALYLTISTIITFILHKYYSFRKIDDEIVDKTSN